MPISVATGRALYPTPLRKLLKPRALMQRSALAFSVTIAIAASAHATLDPTSVRAAAAYSASHRGESLLVLQAGKTLYESSANSARKIYSGTKAFWCLAALAAAQDGLLSLDDRVADTLPAWREDPRKSHVTIRQLLDFSCGLDPGFRLHNDDPGDRDAIALRLPMVADPGAAFIYGPSSLQVFHAVLKAKLHGQAPRGISNATCCAGLASVGNVTCRIVRAIRFSRRAGCLAPGNGRNSASLC